MPQATAFKTYLPLEEATIIAVNTKTIEATNVVPKVTLIRYSAADCQKVSRSVDKRTDQTKAIIYCQQQKNKINNTFAFSAQGSIFILKDLLVSLER